MVCKRVVTITDIDQVLGCAFEEGPKHRRSVPLLLAIVALIVRDNGLVADALF